MPKYLTISDDLQLIAGQGCRFLSRSGKELAAVESEVEDWVQDNSAHPRLEEAELWLDSAFDELQRRVSTEDRKKTEETLIHEMEKLLRRIVRTGARSKGWSREKIRHEANRRAGMAARASEASLG